MKTDKFMKVFTLIVLWILILGVVVYSYFEGWAFLVLIPVLSPLIILILWVGSKKDE